MEWKGRERKGLEGKGREFELRRKSSYFQEQGLESDK
jgi:hypothetical protein